MKQHSKYLQPRRSIVAGAAAGIVALSTGAAWAKVQAPVSKPALAAGTLAFSSVLRARDAELPVPTVRQGAIELELRGITRGIGVHFGPQQAQDGANGDEVGFDFVARATRNTPLIASLCSLHIEEAVSEGGQAASPRLYFGSSSEVRNLSPSEVALHNDWRLPSSASHRLARLKGTLQLAQVAKTETWRIPGLFDKPNQAQAQEQVKTILLAGVAVRYRLAVARPLQPGSQMSFRHFSGPNVFPGEGYRVSILVLPSDSPQSRQSGSLFFKLSNLPPTMRLLDAQGREFRASLESNPYPGGVLDTVFAPTPEQAASKAAPATFEMEVVTQISEFSVPFAFSNLPLPTMEPLPPLP